MGICESNTPNIKQKNNNKNPNIIQQNNNKGRKDELCIDNTPISLNVIDEIKKSICKIKITSKSYGTGFFMIINSQNYLITNYHVINENIKNIEIELTNKQIIKLNLNNRIIKYIKQPKDITIIQIYLNEIKNIKYLDYDLNYVKGYNQYLNMKIISLGINMNFIIIFQRKKVHLVHLLYYQRLKKLLVFINKVIKKKN